MIEKIRAYIGRMQMIAKGDRIIAGVSGGADSVCLLLVLLELREELGFEITVLHVEHGIRGAASLEDAAFVEELCRKYEVGYVRRDYDVPGIAEKLGLSVEETGRKLRYEAFEAEAAKYQHAKIAVAHNSDDNAETMLFHLARGSRASGLAGIAPVRGRVIRPLLCVERAEIEAYLKEKGQSYRTDATNLELIYTRNRIRHTVLPVLRGINPRAVAHMAETADALRRQQEYMQQQTEKFLKRAVRETGQAFLIYKETFEGETKLLREMLLYELMGRLAGSRKDISGVHVRLLEELFAHQPGKRLQLPYQLTAERIYEGVRLQRAAAEEEKDADRCRWLDEAEEFTCKIFDKPADENQLSKKKYTKWFDYDKIKDKLCVRGRQSGDYFYLNAVGGRKKIKQYFIDEKIPREQREELLLVAENSHILWIVGYRISAGYKVTEGTKRILEIKYNGGREDE